MLLLWQPTTHLFYLSAVSVQEIFLSALYSWTQNWWFYGFRRLIEETRVFKPRIFYYANYGFFFLIFISITWYITLIHHNISHNIWDINYTGLRSIKLLVLDKRKEKNIQKFITTENWRRLVNKDDIYCIYSGHRASHNLHHVYNFRCHSFF